MFLSAVCNSVKVGFSGSLLATFQVKEPPG